MEFLLGKTTLLREIASALASPEFKQLVMVVDTSNEIAGDSDIPHSAIGRARRMQVPVRDRQHEQMIESVQNHNPDVIEIDEIGTSAEVQAARTISQRGVSLIATAHGGSFVAALRNTVLRPLFGGIQAVILSASEAKIDHNPTGASRPRKTVLERKEDPTFRYLIELVASNHLRIYHNIQEAVDSTLKDDPVLVEERWVGPEGKIYGRYAWVEAPKDASSALMHDFQAAFATIE
jgi:stage III sporulation protein SpoIIIAA